MVKEFENVKVGAIEYDYIAINTESATVEKTYIIKNKHKYEWKLTGTNNFGVWDLFVNTLNGKEYNNRVYNNDVVSFLKGV